MSMKPGEHPLTDIIQHGETVFSPPIDQLVKEIYQLGGWQNSLAAAYLLCVHSQLLFLGRDYKDLTMDEREARHKTLLNNMRYLLEHERNRAEIKKYKK